MNPIDEIFAENKGNLTSKQIGGNQSLYHLHKFLLDVKKVDQIKRGLYFLVDFTKEAR